MSATPPAATDQLRVERLAAFRAGWNYGETTEDFVVSYEIDPAPMQPGTYRNISGNLALAYGLIAASHQSGLPLFLGAYPITPASDILHELSKHKNHGVRTFQTAYTSTSSSSSATDHTPDAAARRSPRRSSPLRGSRRSRQTVIVSVVEFHLCFGCGSHAALNAPFRTVLY